MGAITIFWKDGCPCGTCIVGQEESWSKVDGHHQQKYDRTTSSTDAKWHAYARARADKKYGGGGMNEEQAQRFL